jgi:hypothetical protein
MLARRGDGPVPRWFEGWLDAEGKADTLRLWSPVLLPGLLQTAEYARALFLAMGVDEQAADEQVAVRLGRQGILDRPDSPHLVTVLYEAVLHHLVGRPGSTQSLVGRPTGPDPQQSCTGQARRALSRAY